jgi:peptidyl-prolyl cis-trans isomerase C
MNMIKRATTAFSLVALFAAHAVHAQDQVVATVNGVKIPESYMDFMLKTQEGKPAGKHPDELRKVIRETLINQEVVVQEAKRSGLLKKPDVQAAIAISWSRAKTRPSASFAS